MSVEDLYKPHAMEKDQNAAMESLDEVESRKKAWEDIKTKNNLARFVDTELRGIENLAITKALEYQDVYNSLARDYGDSKVKETVFFELQDAIEKRMFFHEPKYEKGTGEGRRRESCAEARGHTSALLFMSNWMTSLERIRAFARRSSNPSSSRLFAGWTTLSRSAGKGRNGQASSR